MSQEVYNILLSIIEYPNVPRFYRQLRDYYIRIGKNKESLAISKVIHQKFNDNSSNNNI